MRPDLSPGPVSSRPAADEQGRAQGRVTQSVVPVAVQYHFVAVCGTRTEQLGRSGPEYSSRYRLYARAPGAWVPRRGGEAFDGLGAGPDADRAPTRPGIALEQGAGECGARGAAADAAEPARLMPAVPARPMPAVSARLMPAVPAGPPYLWLSTRSKRRRTGFWKDVHRSRSGTAGLCAGPSTSWSSRKVSASYIDTRERMGRAVDRHQRDRARISACERVGRENRALAQGQRRLQRGAAARQDNGACNAGRRRLRLLEGDFVVVAVAQEPPFKVTAHWAGPHEVIECPREHRFREQKIVTAKTEMVHTATRWPMCGAPSA
jgi:hypothetical protein